MTVIQENPETILDAVAPLHMRILCVDDNHDAADSLAEILRIYGADVRVCYDGIVALTEAEDFSPQVGIFDIHMPGFDGCELARRIRSHGPSPLFLIAMTGVSDDYARQRTKAAGFDVHLTKAAPLEVLLNQLADCSRWLSHP
ncbi:response regulator [Fimbriiglobus ruber]|uniref:Chemotaxis protein methyltransferase CheR n=1 Tax=Fimbriiglobus ruber TaxID=1908690 RepID=A0A225E513_9BACT|nr:response regulator [Fimbriiglobus ruber]OWK46844.1 Chemotaxis protein methyltransferase CheR [Fimbriiglobus ruber]